MARKAKLIRLSILMVLLMVFGALVLSLGGRMADVYAEAELRTDGRTQIRAGVMSSIGYVRTMDMEVVGEEVYIDFYRTFGINQRLGAQNEFIVNIPQTVQRVYVWQFGEYRLMCTRAADGGWEKTE